MLIVESAVTLKPFLVLLFFASIVLGADRPYGRASAGRSASVARNGMVATSEPQAAQAGLEILRAGGNAFDAAVATAAALAVVEPMMTGPGGDLFVLAWVAETEELVGLNASGFSPAAVGPEFFAQRKLDKIPPNGPFTVTVPGAVHGWATLVEKHGSMPLADLLAPAIRYAEEGFPVSPIVAGEWAANGPQFSGGKEFNRVYLGGKSQAPGFGDVFRNPDLAKTLRQIAEGGPEAFYEGDFARRAAEYFKTRDWPVTAEDFAHQHSDWVEPISTDYKGYQVYELPPNGQGMAALEILNLVEPYDLRAMGHNSTPYLHTLIEATRLAFADLDAWLADPERSELPTETLISKAYADERRKLISPDKAAEEATTGVPPDGDTVYLTVVDKDRNAVSFINSISGAFGSGEVVPGTGVILHNRGAGFTLEAGHPNRIAGRKRPYHTIIPAMVMKDDKPWLSFGVMGGGMQPQGHVQVLLNMLEFGMDPQEAGEAARYRVMGDEVALESGVGATVAQELILKGHKPIWAKASFGGYQAIRIDWERGVLIGGSDPRKDGAAVGW